MTPIETMVIIACLLVLTVTLVPVLSTPRLKNALGCVNQLKRIGNAFAVWEADHHGHYPVEVSAADGGAREDALAGRAKAVFLVMSNELGNPKVLVCPANRAGLPAATFHSKFTARNVSYFVGANIHPGNPEGILSGDDNLEILGERVKSGRWEIVSNTPVIWAPGRHKFYGNIALADGSVEGINNSLLKNALCPTNTIPRLLAIP